MVQVPVVDIQVVVRLEVGQVIQPMAAAAVLITVEQPKAILLELEQAMG